MNHHKNRGRSKANRGMNWTRAVRHRRLFLRSGTELSVPVDLDPSRAVTINLAARVGGRQTSIPKCSAATHCVVRQQRCRSRAGGLGDQSHARSSRNAELVVRARGDVLVDAIRVSQPTANAETRSLPILNGNLDGQLPNTDDWEIANAEWSFNNEEQFYAQDCVSVREGTLHLTALNRPVGTRKYSSGHATTKHQHAVKWGRWEVRARLPEGRGYWPAIWLLPTDGSWPPEVDIMEFIGHEPNKVHHSAHWGPLRDGLKPWDLGQTSTKTFAGSPTSPKTSTILRASGPGRRGVVR